VKPFEISVVVESRFLPEQSDAGKQQFLFAYTVRITNTGQRPAQVISRHWVIVDGKNERQDVRGLGVVGQRLSVKHSGWLHARQVPVCG
jgi:ApaG protein